MIVINILALVLGIAALVYMCLALVKPEWF